MPNLRYFWRALCSASPRQWAGGCVPPGLGVWGTGTAHSSCHGTTLLVPVSPSCLLLIVSIQHIFSAEMLRCKLRKPSSRSRERPWGEGSCPTAMRPAGQAAGGAGTVPGPPRTGTATGPWYPAGALDLPANNA